jgi:hypothetical protein
MRTKLSVKIIVVTVLLVIFDCHFETTFAQGSLTPPGAPAPTMKSLDQIEPRTAITNSGFVLISKPGSYYLTTNITVGTGDGIDINASNVVLDLNGYTVSSTAASANGIGIWISSGIANVTVQNGFVTGSATNNGSGVFSGGGFLRGVMTGTSTTANVLVSHVSVSGVTDEGIYLPTGSSSTVDSCTAYAIGNNGITAPVVRNSAASECHNTGISGESVSDCRGAAYGVGVSGTTVNNCYGRTTAAGGTGVSATTAINCTGYTTNGIGVIATSAMNCSGTAYGSGIGVYASTANNCYGSSSTGYGLQILSAATGCSGTSSTNTGIYASGAVVTGCIGVSSGSGAGIYASVANNSSGTSSSGNGLQILMTATGCFGSSTTGIGINGVNLMACTGARFNGTAIQATVGSGCYASTGTNLISLKYNMP